MEVVMSVRIGLGMATFPFSSVKNFWRWIDLCEDSLIDSFWQTDRIASPQPFLESMSMMAAVAGATKRLKFGMNVVVLPFRDPMLLAKECATIDFISEGRLLPAFGVGAQIAPEWGAQHRTPKGRGRQSDEALALMQRFWTEESVTHDGEFYQYTNASVSPKPVQDPIPLWIGGSSKAAIRRTAEIGTGWLAGLQTAKQVTPVVAAIREQSAAAGRPLDEDHYGAGFAFRFGSWDDPIVDRAAQALSRRAQVDVDPNEYYAVGEASDIVARVEEYKRAGVSKFVLSVLASGDDEIFSQTQQLIDEVLPLVHE
jgi:probable F420-dependent oxidoreductase